MAMRAAYVLQGSRSIPLASKRAPEALLQRRPVDWLGEIRNRSALHNLVTGAAEGICGHEDNRHSYARAYEMLLELRAAHSVHVHVSDQTLGSLEGLRAQERFTRPKGLDVIPNRL